jgi:hypothetical protein
MKNDDDFVLGGKGYDVEFCAFCDAVRKFCWMFSVPFV